MRIALADDHALFRAGLRSTLTDTFGDAVEVSEAKDFNELAALLASDLEFDLILCDLRMPGMDPANGIRELAAGCPGTPLVMISASEDPADACRSMEQGARGYILKNESLAVLQRAIELVLAGGLYLSASLLLDRLHLQDAEKAVRAPKSLENSVPQLSARQRMIFECLVDGKPNKVIARELGIAEGTVKAQLRAVFRKLGVRNRTQAALYAAEILDRGGGERMCRTSVAVGSDLPHSDLAVAASRPLPIQPVKGASLKVVTSRD